MSVIDQPTATAPPVDRSGAKPDVLPPPSLSAARWGQVVIGILVVVPLLALVAAIPVAWGWGLSWLDVAIFVVFYLISGFGITVGFHRYLTHGSFKAKRPLRVGLAVAGSMAIEGDVTTWVADHRRHHLYSDREGDPHSPWRFGDTFGALCKGMFYAHVGWLFKAEISNKEKFCPDLLADRDIVQVTRRFPWIVAFSLLAPAAVGGLLTWSWTGALTAYFWASLVRVCLLHHVTWSINSICHTLGEKPFKTRDKSTNVWPLAILSLGESWHNLHHADPTCARHGVMKGQLDPSAALIRGFERLGWAYDVRWPDNRRIEARRLS